VRTATTRFTKSENVYVVPVYTPRHIDFNSNSWFPFVPQRLSTRKSNDFTYLTFDLSEFVYFPSFSSCQSTNKMSLKKISRFKTRTAKRSSTVHYVQEKNSILCPPLLNKIKRLGDSFYPVDLLHI